MNVMLQDNFRRKLSEALQAKEWSQTDLAREIGVSRQLVGDYYHGRKSPGLDVVERFAKALDVDPWNLIDDQPLRVSLPIG